MIKTISKSARSLGSFSFDVLTKYPAYVLLDSIHMYGITHFGTHKHIDYCILTQNHDTLVIPIPDHKNYAQYQLDWDEVITS